MKKSLFFALAACLILQTKAQSVVTVDSYVAAIKSNAQQSTEQAYLQFDRGCYNAGDTIFFKAYVLSGAEHQLSKISRVLHVDLIGKRDSVIQSLLLQLQNGTSAGDFALPKNLQAGYYRVRAYTQWMRNQGDSSFFYKAIPVSGNGYAGGKDKDQGKISVQFYPEAGTFVTGIPVRMAFKVTRANGAGIDAEGMVTDDGGITVAKFKSAHLGLGHFYITAKPGKSYRAKLNIAGGASTTYDLPKAQLNGLAMTINNADSSKFSIDINATKPYYLQNRNKNITMVISDGVVIKTVKIALDNQIIGFDMPKKDLPEGLATVALFGPDDVIIGERLLFVQHDAIAGINVMRNDNNIKVAAPSTGAGSYSVSITNESKGACNDTEEPGLASTILLTSALADPVEQAAYYLENHTADALNNLDILLLTQKLLKPLAPANTFEPETSLQIMGKLTTKKGQPLGNEKVSIVNDGGQSAQAVTDSEGKFTFGNAEFNNGSKFFINVEDKAHQQDAIVTISSAYRPLPVMPDKPSVDKVFTPSVEPLAVNNLMMANNAMARKQLKTAPVAAYHTTSLAGAGNADQVIFMKDLPKAPNLSQALVGVARGIDFANGNAYLRNGAVMSNGQTSIPPMMVVVDGAVTGNHNMDIVSMTDVDNIEILKGANAAIYGLGAGSGVIIINTKQGVNAGSQAVSSQMSPGIFSVTPRGYDISHVYKERRNANFWQPNLNIDQIGNASISFDGFAPGVYRVLIEGVDNGRISSLVYRYTVH